MATTLITSWQIDREKVETVTDFIWLGYEITVDGDSSQKIKRCLLLGRKTRQHIKNQRHHFADKDPYSQSCGFSSSHVQMWELDHKEAWVLNNWCFWTVVLEKTLESPLDSREMKPVNPKGDQPWIFFGRTDTEAEAPILWLPDAKSQFIGRDTDIGKHFGQEEKGLTEDEIAGCLENSMNRGTWQATVHGVTKKIKKTSKILISLRIQSTINFIWKNNSKYSPSIQ